MEYYVKYVFFFVQPKKAILSTISPSSVTVKPKSPTAANKRPPDVSNIAVLQSN